MTFPLGLSEISLWLAITALILLITSELLPPHAGRTNIYIDRKRLRNAALAVSLLFLVIVAATTIRVVFEI